MARRRWLIGVLALLCCGCPGAGKRDAVGEQPSAPGPKTVVLYGRGSTTLAPSGAGSVDTSAFLVNVFEGLVRFDAEMLLAPGLADSWESQDLETYTFVLAPDLHWSDGEPLSAADVAASFELFLREAKDWTWVLEPIRGAKDVVAGKAQRLEGVEVLDARHLRVTLEQPDGLFLQLLALAPAGIFKRAADSHPIGAGPWRVRSASGGKVVLEPNQHYHRQKPALDRLELAPAGFDAAAFSAGRVHVLDVSETGAQGVPPETVRHYPGLNVQYAAFSPSVPWEVRILVNRAFDRKRFCAEELGGRAVPSRGVLPPGMAGHRPDLPELSAAALPELQEKVTLRASLSDGLFAALQRDLAPHGVTLVREEPYDLVQRGWIADYPDPDNFLRVLFHSASGPSLNTARYANGKLDALVTRARRMSAELEQGARLELYQQAEDLVLADLPWLFLWHEENAIAVSPKLRGLRTCPLDMGGYLELAQTGLKLDSR